MGWIAWRMVALLGIVLVCAPAGANMQTASIPAFPGAEGFGAHTRGAFSGKQTPRILFVTNLDDRGPGSLRAAVSKSAPRVIVFRIGGTIVLKSNLAIKHPFVTIAGQTAPGQGICLRGAALTIKTHDVIVRGMRIRVGDDINGPRPSNRDALQIEGRDGEAFNIIVDHCSFSWAIDELCTVWGAQHDISLQWNIFSEPLNHSLHPDGRHAKAVMFGPGSQRISFHHNLIAHSLDRNPLIAGYAKNRPEWKAGATEIEVINNVVYNYGWPGGRITSHPEDPGQRVHFIGNHWIEGTDNIESSSSIFLRDTDCAPATRVFIKDNIGKNRPTNTGDDWLLVNRGKKYNPAFRSDSFLFPPSGVGSLKPPAVFQHVLQFAGAIAPVRDGVDERVVRSVVHRTGKVIDTLGEVGGWPAYPSVTSAIDTDNDGMPDSWEERHGLSQASYEDAFEDRDADGYRNIEEYFNSLITSPL